MYLKKEVLEEIRGNYQWNTKMDFYYFCRANSLSTSNPKATEAYDQINDRYLEWIDKNM